MKVLFIVYHNLVEHSGISKKILSQVDGLRATGADVSLCTLQIAADGTKTRVVDGRPIRTFGMGLMAKVRKHTSYADIVRYVASSGTEAVYIRYDINADPFTVSLVRRLRRMGVRIYVEIPTWPYDGEFRGQRLSLRLQLWVDKCFRRRFFHYCHRAVTYVDVPDIFGCPTLPISNGIDFRRVPLSPAVPFDGTLRMLSVANVHLWHGLDRLLCGMGEHPEVKAELHIVGDGLESLFDDYRHLIQHYGLEDRVQILGPLYGDALDREFAWCNLAVGSLGRHRSGINTIKTLKNREYAARGRAFFYSETDSDFDHAPYVLKVPADDTPIDLPALAAFTAALTLAPEQIRASITSLSWEAQMARILANMGEE